MPANRYVEEDTLAAKLATKRSAGVTQEVNLRETVTCMPLPSVNKAAHSDFETQRRYRQTSQNGGYQWPYKRTDDLQKNFFYTLWGVAE